ncbi:MAG: class I SAM-dependent methyltransferase [Polyangiaceae bacterium]
MPPPRGERCGKNRPTMKDFFSPEMERYLFDHARPAGPLFDELRDRTHAEMQSPQMQVGRIEGALLRILVGATSARRILEIGTFTGYSALSMASALPDDGELVTCDIDPVATKMAREFFDRSPHGKKITIKLGPALATIAALSGPFDVVFLDADKERYPDYYDATLPLLRPGGLLLADNTLWSGEVVDPKTANAKAIALFNAKVAADPRVDNVLVPVRDGLMMARKR